MSDGMWAPLLNGREPLDNRDCALLLGLIETCFPEELPTIGDQKEREG